jgi:hypothetical protein
MDTLGVGRAEGHMVAITRLTDGAEGGFGFAADDG